MSGRDRTTGLLAALLVVLLAIAAWREVLVRPGIDFFQFWSIGRILTTDPTRDVYSPGAGSILGRELLAEARSDGSERRLRAARERPVIEVFSSPLLYVVFGSIATGDYERDYRSYQLVSLLAGQLAVLLLCRALGFGLVPACLASCLLGIPFEPYASETIVANVNRLLLLAMAAYVHLQGRQVPGWRDAAAGGVLGLAILFKPMLAISAALLISSRILDGRFAKASIELGGMSGIALGSLALSVGVLGSAAPWGAWLDALGRLFGEFQVQVAEGNFSLAELMLEETGHNHSLAIGGSLLAAALVAIARGRRGVARPPIEGSGQLPSLDDERLQQRARDCLIMGTGVATMLLAARLAWLHYFLLLAPLLLCISRPRATRERSGIPPVVAGLAWLLASVQPFRLLESRDARIAAWMVVAATALVLAVALIEIARRRTGGQPDEPSVVHAPPPGAERSG